jgi:hypothetical protein
MENLKKYHDIYHTQKCVPGDIEYLVDKISESVSEYLLTKYPEYWEELNDTVIYESTDDFINWAQELFDVMLSRANEYIKNKY